MTSVEFKQLLYKPSVNKSALLSALKEQANYATLAKILRENLSHPMVRHFLYGTPLPKTKEQIRQGKVIFNNQNIDAELAWNILAITKYKDQINKFIDLKQSFDHHFLLEEFDTAATKLAEIESISNSLWTVENSFLLWEFKDGVEKNWAELSDFSKTLTDALTLFLVEHFSKKAEKKITYFRFKNNFQNQISEIIEPGGIREYVCFRLAYPSYIGFDKYAYMLTIEGISPIIDRYLFTRDVIAELVDRHDQLSIKRAVSDLASIINTDKVLAQLKNYLGIERMPLEGSNRLLLLLDEYTRGNFESCISQIPGFLKEFPTAVELYETYVKSLIESNFDFKPTGVSSMIDDILLNLFNLFSRNDRTNDAIERLMKYAVAFYSSNWAKQLFSIVNSQNSQAVNNRQHNLLFILYSNYNNPRLFDLIAPNTNTWDNLAYVFQNNFAHQLTVNVQKNISASEFDILVDNHEISAKRKPLYVGRILMKQNRLQEAKDHYESLKYAQISATSTQEITSNLFRIYRDLGLIRDATRIFVDTYFQNPNISTKLDPSQLLATLISSYSLGIEDDIDLPIFFRLATPDQYNQYVAYDIFMTAIGVDKPSELATSENGYETKKLIYFLREVCTIDILHHSLNFNGTNDIEQERTAILTELIKLDPESENIYIKEITEIAQSSSIRKVIEEVNKGRITVNIPQLKSIETTLLKDGFSRYQELAEYSRERNLTAADFSTKLTDQDLSTLNDEAVRNKIVHSSDPAFINFKSIFSEIRDKYILSKEYGLDGYLSTRIRHGTLLNHIRSVFESQNLISQKNKEGVYIENIYWNDKIPAYLSSKMPDIQDAIKKFSFEIDTLTESIVAEYIQVRTEKYQDKKNAWFDYSFPQELYARLFQITRETLRDHVSFVNFVFDVLGEKTNQLLSGIRDRLNSEIKDKYNNLINSFLEEIREAIGDYTFVDLTSRIVKCSTNIQDELRSISEWFNLSSPRADLFIDIETIIQTAITITNTIYPNNQLSPSISANFDFPIAFYIHLIYILRILLDNIIKHSGLAPEALEVSIDAELVNTNKLKLTLTNNFSTQNTNYIEQRLRLTKENWDKKGTDFAMTNVEGGSGFDKIKRILAIDINATNYDLSFEINENKVSISIELQVKFHDYESVS